LEKKPSMRLSQEPCLGVKVNAKRPAGCVASQATHNHTCGFEILPRCCGLNARGALKVLNGAVGSQRPGRSSNGSDQPATPARLGLAGRERSAWRSSSGRTNLC
jgi:hypothetical protein